MDHLESLRVNHLEPSRVIQSGSEGSAFRAGCPGVTRVRFGMVIGIIWNEWNDWDHLESFKTRNHLKLEVRD